MTVHFETLLSIIKPN